MPLARIDLAQGKSPEYRRTIGDVVYEAVVSELKAPEGDRFQVITEHPAGGIIADPSYLGIKRTADVVFIQVTMNAGRTLAAHMSASDPKRTSTCGFRITPLSRYDAP